METPIDATPATQQSSNSETATTPVVSDVATTAQEHPQQDLRDPALDSTTTPAENTTVENEASSQQPPEQSTTPENTPSQPIENDAQNIQVETTPTAEEITKIKTQNSNPFEELPPNQRLQIQHLIDVGVGTAMMQCQLSVEEVAGLEDALAVLSHLPESEQTLRAYQAIQSLLEDAKLPPTVRITRYAMEVFAQTYAMKMEPLQDEAGYTLTLLPHAEEVENV